jgi:predicted nucleic acid-binding protein
MKIVIDTSVIISVITNESCKDTLINATKGASLIAPESLNFEIGNAFSAMLKRNRVSFEDALSAVHSYEKIPIQFFTVNIEESLKIADDLKIYAYDAYFIECAQRNRSPLLSLDKGLSDAASKYGLKIIEV